MGRSQLLLASIALLAAAAGVPYLLRSQQGAPDQQPRAAMLNEQEVASVWLQLGMTDKAARDWSGKVTVKSGELLTVRNWRPRPGDVVAGSSWKLQSRKGANFNFRAWEIEPLKAPVPYFNLPGVIIDVKGSAATEVQVDTVNGAFTVRPFDLRAGVGTPFLDGAVRAERSTPGERISPLRGQNDFPSLVALDGGQLLTAWVNFDNERNEILTRAFDGREWGPVRALATPHTDIFHVKLARAKNGGAMAVWSAQVDGNFDVYSSAWLNGSWQAPQRLSSDAQPDIYAATATDAKGNVWAVWQGFRNGKSDIFARRHNGTEWLPEERVSSGPGNDWLPAIAADGVGKVYVGWDTYDKGNYDVSLRTWSDGQWSAVTPIADSLKFEAYLSLACDKQNRLWATWSEAGMDWGKDTGFLPRKQGTPLYRDRWMGVSVYDGSRWMEPIQSVNDALPLPLRDHNDLPQLVTDAQSGQVWLFFRHRNLRILDNPQDTPAHRAAWEIHGVTFDGNRWTNPIALPFSGGREDMRYSLASSDTGIYAAWPTDNRNREDFLFERADVFAGKLTLPVSRGASLALRPREQFALKLFPVHPEEAQDLSRIHGYTIDSGGKSYRIYRGDTHRHTEFSADGNYDGSLLDAYRYSIDAAELDFLLVSDHNAQGGPDLPYINWLLQQAADVFAVTGKFVPYYGYERSLGYPNGHRNVLLPKRGVPTLPIPPEETKAITGAKMLYEYLKKNGGIAISHTSATGMGTDWRDNDPVAEPVVEIYQGDRVSAEYEGAPKAAHAGNPASAPGGFRPAGYVWNAWAKGYKLGVQAASDHFSTHISYACTLATDFSREGLLDAMRARHSYGATDNIILDYRVKAGGKEYLQGDALSANGPFELSVKVIGTQPVRQIDIIRSNEFVHTRNPMQQDVSFTFRDTQPKKGESYYYVRVIQVDDQIAWSSPVWITRK